MKLRAGWTRTFGATALALVLAGTGVFAQGIRGIGVQAGAEVVGTLRIDTVSETPTPIFGVAFAVQNAVSDTSGGGGAGKASFSEFKVVRQPDAASPRILKAAVTGEHIKEVTIEVFKAGTTMIESTYTLGDVVVTGFSTENAFENVSFAFNRIALVSSGIRSCFDLKTGTLC